jgi:phage terminase large subunit-like protein
VLLDFCGYELEEDGRLTFHEDRAHRVLVVVFDPSELHDMSTRLSKANIAAFHAMGQTAKRMEADRQLLNLIQRRGLAHNGDPELRMHIMNADRRLDATGKKLRIVKRSNSQRIDLAIAMSMGTYEILRLNL